MRLDQFARELGDRLAGLLPPEQRANVQALVADQVQSVFAQSKLVPKERFDAHVRELDALAETIKRLEHRLDTLARRVDAFEQNDPGTPEV